MAVSDVSIPHRDQTHLSPTVKLPFTESVITLHCQSLLVSTSPSTDHGVLEIKGHPSLRLKILSNWYI